MENSDVVIIINQEMQLDTGELFLTFKLLKRRYRSAEVQEKMRKFDFFHHPYDKNNEIKLLDDLDEPQSLSHVSLATRFTGVEDTVTKRGRQNITDRDEKKEKRQKQPVGSYDSDFEPFDFDTHTY